MRIKETKRKVLSSGEDAEKSRNAEEDRVWVCPHCTFCNDSTAVCSMCAHRRSGLNPDNLMKPVSHFHISHAHLKSTGQNGFCYIRAEDYYVCGGNSSLWCGARSNLDFFLAHRSVP